MWFQIISIPPAPRKFIRNSKGEGSGSKAVISKGWGGGVHGETTLPKGDEPITKHSMKATYDRSEAQKHTYVRCFETKVSIPGH